MRIPLTPQDEFEQAQGGGLQPLAAPDDAGPKLQPVGASVDGAAAAQRPVIPKPNAMPRPVRVPSPEEQSAQANLNREEAMGHGAIWRKAQNGGIKNPILRGLARVADVAGTALFPAITGQIPGTELHHKLEVQGAQNRLKNVISAEDVESQTAERNAQAENLMTMPQFKNAFTAWQAQNPGAPIEKFFEAQQNAKPDKNPTEFSEWRKQNPNAPLSDWFDLKNSAKPDTGTQEDQRYRGIEQKLIRGEQVTADDQAWAKAYEKSKTLGPVTSASLAQPGKNDARSDRSYQFNSGQLEKSGAPIDQAIQRLGRLQDTIAQGNPQADALIAPELLTVMAGGAGSGLRMNQAEISRVVGGRSNWESLKASMNKWKTDPNSARSITPAQQKQIEALVGEVQKKLVAKQAILDEARQALIDADDPHEHRRIVADAKKKLDAIDAGTQQGGVNQNQLQRPPGVPDNYVYNANGPKGAGWYKPTGK